VFSGFADDVKSSACSMISGDRFGAAMAPSKSIDLHSVTRTVKLELVKNCEARIARSRTCYSCRKSLPDVPTL
jgi:hypothetical protein